MPRVGIFVGLVGYQRAQQYARDCLHCQQPKRLGQRHIIIGAPYLDQARSMQRGTGEMGAAGDRRQQQEPKFELGER
jgi:hypothetical protein